MTIQELYEEIHSRYTLLLSQTRNYMAQDINAQEYDKVGLFTQMADELDAEIDTIEKKFSKIAKDIRVNYVEPLRNIQTNTKVVQIEKFLVDAIRDLNKKLGFRDSNHDIDINEDDIAALQSDLLTVFVSYPTLNFNLLKAIAYNKVDKSKYAHLKRDFINKLRAEHGNDYVINFEQEFLKLWNEEFLELAKKDILQQRMNQRDAIKNLVEAYRARIIRSFCRG